MEHEHQYNINVNRLRNDEMPVRSPFVHADRKQLNQLSPSAIVDSPDDSLAIKQPNSSSVNTFQNSMVNKESLLRSTASNVLGQSPNNPEY